MEKQLFDWFGWDGDHECMTFYDVTLKIQIGSHEPGTKFNHAFIMWQEGILQLPGVVDQGYTDYKLNLSVIQPT